MSDLDTSLRERLNQLDLVAIAIEYGLLCERMRVAADRYELATGDAKRVAQRQLAPLVADFAVYQATLSIHGFETCDNCYRSTHAHAVDCVDPETGTAYTATA